MIPEKIKKILYGFVAVIIIAGGIWFLDGYYLPSSEIAPAITTNPIVPTAAPTNFSGTKSVVPPETPSENIKTSVGGNIPRPENKQINITLSAGENAYTFTVPENANVHEAMTILSKTTPFTFTAKEYSGLGYFIEAINGVKNAGGYYWTLYMNGKYSTVGASDLKLSAGDHIEWKYSDKVNY